MLYKEIGMQRRIALCLTNLGRLFIDKGDYKRAEMYLQESLSHCQHYGYDRESVLCLCFLGYLTLKLQRSAAPKRPANYFYSALKLAAQCRSVPAALDVLVGLAILRVHSGAERKAAELLTVILRHSGGEQETKNRAMQLLTKLGAEPRPTKVAPSHERDRTLDLWVVVNQQLARLKKRTLLSPEKRREF